MNRLSKEKQLAVIHALVEGCSIRSTERMTGVHRDTIMRLMVKVGEKCQGILDDQMRGLACDSLEVDEVWTYVARKQARLTYEQRDDETMGDMYVFTAMDPDSKLIPRFEVGKRNMETACRLMGELRDRIVPSQLTTDGFVPYIGAVESAWGMDSPDFAQLIKTFRSTDPGPARYNPPRIMETISTVVYGNPDPRRISTSRIERSNLTIRMACRRFTRLTNAFSKKLDNLKAALALFFCFYNFVRIHGTIRVTPAMAAGITDRVWALEELL